MQGFLSPPYFRSAEYRVLQIIHGEKLSCFCGSFGNRKTFTVK